MQMPQIQMQSQMAQITIEQSAGKQEIRQPKADLSIQQPTSDVSIQTTPSRLTIDQTQAWEDVNLMSTARLIEKSSQEGQSGLFEGMSRRAEQGSELMKIEAGGDAIVQQAIVNGHNQMKMIGMKYIPSHFAVKINYQPSEVHIDAQANRPIIEARANSPEHTYDPGMVDIRIKNYQQLDIDFTNLFSESI